MRTSVVLLVCSLIGSLAGSWLVGRWAVGVVVVAWSLALALFALLRDVDVKQAMPVAATEEGRFRRQVVEARLRRVS